MNERSVHNGSVTSRHILNEHERRVERDKWMTNAKDEREQKRVFQVSCTKNKNNSLLCVFFLFGQKIMCLVRIFLFAYSLRFFLMMFMLIEKVFSSILQCIIIFLLLLFMWFSWVHSQIDVTQKKSSFSHKICIQNFLIFH